MGGKGAGGVGGGVPPISAAHSFLVPFDDDCFHIHHCSDSAEDGKKQEANPELFYERRLVFVVVGKVFGWWEVVYGSGGRWGWRPPGGVGNNG